MAFPILNCLIKALKGIGSTLRIQLMATAPGVTLFLETPTELRRVCVVKTPIAPPKKCYNWQY